MTVEQLDLATLDRVVVRLDQQASTTRVTCVERLLFFALTVSVYAIPLLVGAILVGRTLDSAVYATLLDHLDSLLAYSIIAAAALVPLNLRLFGKALAHERLTRSHPDLRVADFLFGRRGRLEESAHARAMVLHGIPALLSGVLIVSLAAGVWSGRGLGTWTTVIALAACIAFFFVQRRCQQLFDVLRRRVDYAREVMTVRRQLHQRRRQAVDLNAPITLSRNLALRLSDLDRIFVLTNEATTRMRAARPGITGAVVTWESAALEDMADVTGVDRAVIDSAVHQLSVEVARHRNVMQRSRERIPTAMRSALAADGLRLARDGRSFELRVPQGRWRSATVSVAADTAFDGIVVTSVHAGHDDRKPGDSVTEHADGA